MIEAKAKLVGFSRPNWRDKHKGVVALELPEIGDEAVQQLEGKDVRVIIKLWREKRSLDANAYMWVLTGLIAQALDSDTDTEHMRQMRLYAPIDRIDGEPVVITIKSSIDIDRVAGYWRYYDESDDGKWKSWLQLKPSREFDSAEMSVYIHRLIEEAKELGIETATPDEVARMEQLYAENIKKRNN